MILNLQRRLLAFGVLASLAAAMALIAQSTLGTILGNVRDTSGSAVPKVTIKLRNLGTNITVQVVSNELGYYELPLLQAGMYEVTAEAPGFKMFKQSDVELATSRTVRVDVALEVGPVSEQVTVTAEAGTIETERPTITSSRNAEQLRTVPLNYIGNISNVIRQFATVPGAQPIRIGLSYAVAGVRTNTNQFQMDGVTPPKRGSGMNTENEINFEGQEEFRLVSVNATAEYVSPATFQQTSRAGSNQFHVSADYRGTIPNLVAREWFQPARVPRHRNIYGGWLSGPVVIPKLYDGHNRTFFMLSYRGSYGPIGSLNPVTVPTSQFRSGDFSQLRDPAFLARENIASPITIVDPDNNNQPIPNNTIPASRINAVSDRIQQRFYPLPTTPNALFNNYIFQSRTIGPGSLYGLRIDHRFSDKDFIHVSGIATQEGSGVGVLSGILPTNGYATTVTDNRAGTVAWNHLFGPAAFNEIRIGWTRTHFLNYGPFLGNVTLQSFGITGTVYNNPAALGFPVINISAFPALSQPSFARNVTQGLQFLDGYTIVRGAHTIKTGFDYRRARGNDHTLDSNTFGNFTFTNSFTGYAYSDFLLGIPTTTARSSPRDSQYEQNTYIGFYIQDDYKLRENLTLNLGLRYDYQFPITDKDSLLFNFDPKTGSLVLPSEEIRRSVNPLLPRNVNFLTAQQAGMPAEGFRNTDKNNFGPRVGVAYRFTKNTVLRGGYGVYYNIMSLGFIGSQQQGGIFNFSESFSNISGVRGRLRFPNPFDPVGAIGNINVNGFTANFPNLQTMQWNMTLERAIWAGIGLRVSYVGTRGIQLAYRRGINKPLPSTIPFSTDRLVWPQFRNVTLTEPGANSEYHGLQLGAKRQWKNGFLLDINYSFAHAYDDAEDGDTGSMLEIFNNRRAEHARTSYVCNMRTVINAMYELPLGRGKKILGAAPRWLDTIVGGWQSQMIIFLTGGAWNTVTFSGRDPSNTDTVGGRADRIADGNLPVSQRTINRYFDVSAFSVPPLNAGRFGTGGRYVIEGPGSKTVHISVLKSFKLTERLKFQLMATMQNAFNHPIFADPVTDITQVGTVGRVPRGFTGQGEGGRAREIGANAYLIF